MDYATVISLCRLCATQNIDSNSVENLSLAENPNRKILLFLVNKYLRITVSSFFYLGLLRLLSIAIWIFRWVPLPRNYRFLSTFCRFQIAIRYLLNFVWNVSKSYTHSIHSVEDVTKFKKCSVQYQTVHIWLVWTSMNLLYSIRQQHRKYVNQYQILITSWS